ncbi:DinB family protein [Streptomyces sp. SLBN-118]|uniref:DinB family protein n=1 Tax=Streptomyces sp. SLBN-118 TaxID=2768454 RepID=UPI0021B33D83|nr:DinB family protein [Streptomyces sp. SLBN-118]
MQLASGVAASPVTAPSTGHVQEKSPPGTAARDLLPAQIAEYARHCGHPDLLRERVDGRVGQ